MAKKQIKKKAASKQSKPKKLDSTLYEAELERLQTELVHLQDWVKRRRY